MTNVISADRITDTHYLHSGFSATVSDSYSSPSGAPSGITWDGSNVISADNSSDTHYLHSGFSSTISDSYSSPSSIPSGITWDGRYAGGGGVSVEVSINEDLDLADQAAVVWGGARGSSDPLDLSDLANPAHSAQRSQDDPLGLVDDVNIVLYKFETDFVGIVDSTQQVLHAAIDLSESMGLGDDVTTEATLTRVVTDLVSMLDDANLGRLVLKQITDALALTDESVRAVDSARSITNILGMIDTSQKSVARAIVDLLALTDGATAGQIVHRAVAETLGLTDDQQKLIIKSVLDALTLQDTTAHESQMLRTIIEQIDLLDAASAGNFLQSIVTDALGLSDTRETLKDIQRQIDDLLAGTDTLLVQAAGIINLSITDALGIVDEADKQTDTQRFLLDPLGLVDDVTLVRNILYTVADMLVLQDQEVRESAFVRSVLDLAGLADTWDVSGEHIQVLVTDLLAIADDLEAVNEFLVKIKGTLATVNKIKGTIEGVSEKIRGEL